MTEPPEHRELDPESRKTERVVRRPPKLPEIPRFHLLRKIGEGGMGEVYEAEQVEPVCRKVAIKLIRSGMESRDILARFERERQSLALMNHPNIAAVYDAGVTPDERPFFVMEYVPGVPIDRYCDEHHLSTHRRLELFLHVCAGLQHAHHKGVIHRDVKPANILVAIEGNDAVPKIIDFGVARATNPIQGSGDSRTLVGDFIGTPEYMSPEQADPTSLDIDTRSDVYSLGVVLYELLAGARPFDSKQLTGGGFVKMQRIIRESDPPRPSTRLSKLGKKMDICARNRGTGPKDLVREITGDLDCIALKALEKDRTRRYDSPAALADDIRRFLNDEPIMARAPSLTYRAGKFVRRHTLGVAAALIVILALAAGSTGITVGFLRARRAEKIAEREARAARQVSDYLVDLFRVADPRKSKGEEVTAREILDRGVERIGTDLEDQPIVKARLLHVMGSVYKNLGLYDRASALFREALRIRESLLSPDDPDIASTLNALGLTLFEQGKYDEGRRLVERALAIRKRELGSDHPDVAISLNNLALIHWKRGNYDQAEPLYRQALAILEKTPDRNEADIGMILENMAAIHYSRGEYEKARSLMLRALQIRKRLKGPNDLDVAKSLGNLAAVEFILGEYESAGRRLARSLAIREKVLGPQHPDVAFSLRNLAIFYKKMKEPEKAEPLLVRAMTIQRQVLPKDHPSIASTLNSLAGIYNDRKEYNRALPLYREALKISKKALGPENPKVTEIMVNLGICYRNLGQYADSEKILTSGLAIQEKSLGPTHLEVARNLHAQATLYERTKKFGKAERSILRSIDIRDKTLKPGHPDRIAAYEAYEKILRSMNRTEEADRVGMKIDAESEIGTE